MCFCSLYKRNKKALGTSGGSPNADTVVCPSPTSRLPTQDLKTFSSQQTIDALNSLIPPKLVSHNDHN